MIVRSLVAAAAILTVCIVLIGSSPAARAATEIKLPFPAGYSAGILQGYNGGTHRGVDQYSLDLVVENAATNGAPVLSPIAGRIDWAYGPWVRNGCLAILDADGSGRGVMLCHVIFDRSFGRGEAIALGQRLGYVGPPGAVGNNGAPHVHLQLYRGGAGARTPLPFTLPSGLPLDGWSLPNGGRYNEHGGKGGLVSTNGAPSPAGGDSRSVTGTSSRGAATRPEIRVPAFVRLLDGCLSVRAEPSLEAEEIDCLLDGTTVTVLEGPTEADDLSWYRLEDFGWVVGDSLRPAAE